MSANKLHPVPSPALSADAPLTADALLPRNLVLREVLCCSVATAWRNELVGEPGWPMPVKQGDRVFYRRSDVERYIASLPLARRGVTPSKRQAKLIATAERRRAQQLTQDSEAPRPGTKAAAQAALDARTAERAEGAECEKAALKVNGKASQRKQAQAA